MIGLMDCNNFFVSCERLFRPDLRGKPVAVLSSNDGCIVSRSQEVKDLGIPMGIPYFEVKEQCAKEGITIFSSNFTLYRDLSQRVMRALREEVDQMEIYSIDEAFFHIPDSCTKEDVISIRERIMQKTGIPVSFGIAPTKTIAKIANTEAKKGDGVTWLTEEGAHGRYAHVTCGSVWGIGRQTSKRLSELGIGTVEQFLAKGRSFARQEFGVVGERLFYELMGQRVEREGEEEIQASIMSTRSFSRAVTDKETLLSAVGYHITELGEKLRARGVMASELSILCAPSRFSSYMLRNKVARQVLEVPTWDTAVLLRVAHTLCDRLYEKDVPYKKAGAFVSGLVPAQYVSPSLFARSENENRSGEVYKVVDALNARFGHGTVRPGRIASTSTWAARSESRSQAYTTEWSQIARVKAV